MQEVYPVLQISKARRGKHTKISPDNMSFSSAEGYRSVQSNRGTYSGTWFFEITVVHLGSTGHCRLGVGTARQEIDAPCGYTESSFGYRDVDGSKVHKAWREPYAKLYREGDTIGCVSMSWVFLTVMTASTCVPLVSVCCSGKSALL